MDWFLYHNGLRHERVKEYHRLSASETLSTRLMSHIEVLTNIFFMSKIIFFAE